jgi:hypothetical protein
MPGKGGESTESIQPCQRAFHHPPVPAQALAGLNPPAGDAALDAPLSEVNAAKTVVVSFIGVKFFRAATWPPYRPLIGGMASTIEVKTVQSCLLTVAVIEFRGPAVGVAGDELGCLQVSNCIRAYMLSRKLFENVNSLFANESDGYKTASAPSAFRFSCGRNAMTGQESTPE